MFRGLQLTRLFQTQSLLEVFFIEKINNRIH